MLSIVKPCQLAIYTHTLYREARIIMIDPHTLYRKATPNHDLRKYSLS